MTEPTDKQPASNEQAPVSAPPRIEPSSPTPSEASRRALAVLALLIALLALLLAAGGGYYLWDQQQRLAAGQRTLASNAALAERAEQLAAADSALQERLQSLSQDADANTEALRQQLETLQRTQETVQERLGRLDVQTQARHGEWLRAEAAYLANLAVIRIGLQRDVDGALAALKMADELLSRLNSRAIAERQAVNRAINRLVAVDVPDTPELARRIDALVTKIDILPLNQPLDEAMLQQQAPPADGDPAPGDWRARLERAWQRFRDTLGQLVLVQRGKPAEPLIVPEERYFLYHNLRLRLEAARLALIQGDQAIYQSSLDRAAEWLERYFLRGEPAVDAALAEIAALRAVDIQPDLPDLAPLLEPVTRY